MNFLRRTKFILLAIIMTSGISLGYTALAHASAKTDVCAGVNLTGSTGCGGGDAEISKVVKVVIQLLSLVAGIAAVVMIIVAGLKYITSNGDASNLSSAKNSLIYALVGIVVVALAQVIVHFVLGKV